MAPGAASWAASGCSFDGGLTLTPLVWSGQGAPVLRRAPSAETGSRLVVDAHDEAGLLTEFLLDTGTSCAFVSDEAAAARSARTSARRVRLLANEGSCSYPGRDATIPVMDLGGLRASDLPVFILERAHDLRYPANVIGMSWVSGLALAHDARGDAWSLLRSGAAGPFSGGGETMIAAPGLPVVPLVDERGRTVYGLVDTGTPTSLVEAGTAHGRYLLKDASGNTLLQIDARTDAPWSGLRPGGRPVTVWIGLDALSTRSFTLDFTTRRWTFAP